MSNSSELILGDILVNKINGKYPLDNQSLNITSNIDNNGIAILTFQNNTLPINFTCLYNKQAFYPDFTWNSNYTELTLDFGKKPNNLETVEIIFIN